MTDELEALLPLLVAELVDDDTRRQVEDLAQVRGMAIVPLIDAPVDGSLHVLEVTTPGQSESLFVLAEPLGSPTERGFPLRLHPYDSPPAQRSIMPLPGAPQPATLRARRTGRLTLSPDHMGELRGEARERSRPSYAPELLMGNVFGGKYEITALLGSGTSGTVYRARHALLGTTVAVKIMHERYSNDLQFSARLHEQALKISQLDHPNVVRITDYGQEPDGHLYVAMECLEGTSLDELLKRDEFLTLPRIVDLTMQIAAGLGHAHTHGIVHGDLRPRKIVLVNSEDDEGQPALRVRIRGFGAFARAGGGEHVGHPAYMSPQQCVGEPSDVRGDIYALGIILYELATGRVPFVADDHEKLIAMQCGEAPPPPSSIRAMDRRLEKLILRMIEKAPADRLPNMRSVRAELRELLLPPELELHGVGAGAQVRKHGGVEGRAPVIAPSTMNMRAVPDIRAITARLVREPVSMLREALSSPERFAAEAQTLAAAMQVLLTQGEFAALAHVVALLCKVAADPALADGRSELSVRLVKALQDPARLASAAERALTDHEEAASTLLASLGLAAAHALYAARVRAHPTPPVRGRFVATLRAIGLPCLPLVATALQRNAPGEANPHDVRLGEDLLRAIPVVSDESVGGVVAKYFRWGDTALRRAAIPPLVSLWGDRARPLLLGALQKDPDEATRVAAVRGLRDLHAIDEHVVRKAEEFLTGSAAASEGFCVALASALQDTEPTARPLAASILRRILTPKGGMFAALRSKAKSTPTILLIAMARSFLAIGGPEAPKLIEELARQCEESARGQLLAALSSYTSTG